MSDQDKAGPVERILAERQLDDFSGFTDGQTGEITDRKQALAWVNEQAERHGLPAVRERLATAADGVIERHQGDYLQLLTMICKAQQDWSGMEACATRAEHLHVGLGDPVRAANAAVHRSEARNAQGDHDGALEGLEQVAAYLDEADRMPEPSGDPDEDERAAAEKVRADARNGYGEVQRIALMGIVAANGQEQVAAYCARRLEQPRFKEEELALLLVTADMQAVEKDHAGSMATLRRVEGLAAEIDRRDIAANAALGQAATSLQEFNAISAPDDFRRASDHLRAYPEQPEWSPTRFKAQYDNLMKIRGVLEKLGLINKGQLVVPGR